MWGFWDLDRRESENKDLVRGVNLTAKLNKRQGEKLEMKDGVLQCKAYNGGNSSAGVRAQARCCRLSGLTCEYRVAGPSLPFEGAQAEATCPSNTQPFGCSSHSRYPDMDGTYQDVNASSCVAQSGHPALADPAARSGSVVFASCCSGPSLNCIRVTSQETGLVRGDQQQVTCPSSYVMVSCAYFAPNGKSGGASIVRDVIGKGVLRGIMGASMNTGSSGVTATATCCKMIAVNAVGFVLCFMIMHLNGANF
ncbi:proprotein convertase subtilisin/kexin type 9-like [Pomacea canaliculata]|uniref:proprotein convertase subtilisin/kexin type 9-like n=1 Tax=Pomacea canaliculata TaxID=400727 RepID=UPI000D72FF6C|nr:proprotein convertase subtilisin/kexin type 9-like [Pomacea canaliculata]